MPTTTKLGTQHPWVKGIQVCSNDPIPFPKEEKQNSKNALSNLFPQNRWARFNQTWHKALFGDGGLKFIQIEGHALFKQG